MVLVGLVVGFRCKTIMLLASKKQARLSCRNSLGRNSDP